MQTKPKHKKGVLKTQKKTTRVPIDFPVNQHRELKALAALERFTLQEYIRSRVIKPSEEHHISDEELNPIVEKIIQENKAR